MRAAVAIGCLAVLAFARPSEEEERFAARVAELVSRLDSPSEAVRRAAYMELSSFGRRAVPLLRDLDCPSAALAHRVDQLLVPWRRLSLHLVEPEVRLPAAVGLRLSAVLSNDSLDYWQLPGSEAGPGSGLVKPFIEGLWVEVAGDPDSRTPVKTVDVIEQQFDPKRSLLPPGGEVRFEIVVPPGDSPLHRGGRHRIRLRLSVTAVRYPAWLLEPGSKGLPSEPGWSSLAPVEEVSEPCTVVLEVHTPGEIARDLTGRDPQARRWAVLELEARNDPELLPVLRDHASIPEVRPIAVRRLGQAALAGDYELIEKLARTDKDPEIRRLAIVALGNYRTADARSALLGITIAGDDQARVAAVGALRWHPHPSTISRFIQILGKGDEVSQSIVRNTLREWTGFDVINAADIASFRRWWNENREQWAHDHEDLIRDREPDPAPRPGR